MIQYKSLVQYTRVVDGVRFPPNINEPYLLVYFSENSWLVQDYSKLNIRRQDVRHAVIPVTKMPVTRLTPELRNSYKQLRVLPYQSNMKIPESKNLFVDTTLYTQTIDEIYKPNTYRQRAGYLIQNLLYKVFHSFPDNYRKILV